MRGDPDSIFHFRNTSAGFTLVEAIVILSLIGIIAAVSAPRFLALSDMQDIRSHRQAINDLRFAQNRAANSGCPVQVDFGTNGYLLTQQTSCRTGAFTLDIPDPATGQIPFQSSLPEGVSISSTLDPLIFDARGRITNASGSISEATILVGTRAIEAIGESGLIRAQ